MSILIRAKTRRAVQRQLAILAMLLVLQPVLLLLGNPSAMAVGPSHRHLTAGAPVPVHTHGHDAGAHGAAVVDCVTPHDHSTHEQGTATVICAPTMDLSGDTVASPLLPGSALAAVRIMLVEAPVAIPMQVQPVGGAGTPEIPPPRVAL